MDANSADEITDVGHSESEVNLMRRFYLLRAVDKTGISGVGIVAWGVQFPDGKVVTRWNGKIAQVSVWECVEDVYVIHGHGGDTRVVWIDEIDSPSRDMRRVRQ